MREPYKPLLFDENSYDFIQIGSRRSMEHYAQNKLNYVDEMYKEMFKAYENLQLIRSIYTYEDYKKDNIIFMDMYRREIDDESEAKQKKHLESFFEINNEMRDYRIKTFCDIDYDNKTARSIMNEIIDKAFLPPTLVDIAVRIGISLEEFLDYYFEFQTKANKIAYWDFTEAYEATSRLMYHSLAKQGLVDGKSLEEYYAHLRQ